MKYLFFIALISCTPKTPLQPAEKPINYIQTSTDFVGALIKQENVTNYLMVFEKANLDQLSFQLGTDQQKITFWVNMYNGYILHILRTNPELYKDRSQFFKKKQINIGNHLLSFADIEHGIIRGSQHEYFGGYMKKWFPSKLEKKLRVKKRDYRIHFALNCGARSCPPVTAYDIDRLNHQLNQSTTNYLKAQTNYDAGTNTAHSTTLFSWFRGDFGGKKGVKKILMKEGLIPDADVDLKYNDYDWTLDLSNFRKE